MQQEKSSQLGAKELKHSKLVGKYLTFTLGGERYGLEILKVQEIISVVKITSVPNSPEYVLGVINLRGKVIPVVDLRVRLGMSSKESDEKTCTIVVNINYRGRNTAIGVLVDTVWEVVELGQDALQPPPDYGVNINSENILGLGRVDENIVILLDIDKTLKDVELDDVAGISSDEVQQ